MIKYPPLAFYAARYWVCHVKLGNVLSHAQDAIQRIFDPTEPYFSAWTWSEQYDEQKASISEKPPTPEISTLHFAAQNDFFDIPEWLITSHSQEPDGFSVIGKTSLYQACSRGNMQVAQLLIPHGAGVNAPRRGFLRPLHVVSYNGRLETSQLLIASGADVNARSDRDRSAFYLAAEEGYLEVVRFLLENGADPNLRRRNGTSGPLRSA